MADVAASRPGTLRANVSVAPVIVAPVVAIGLLIAILFAPILGVQATELARFVADAESDLTALLRGQPAKGTFQQLQPKFLLFSALLLAWLLLASNVTLKLGEGLTSRRMRFGLALAVTLTLPLVLLLKYWVANWAEAATRGDSRYAILNHRFFDILPAFEPGGLWIFAALLLLQTVLVLGLWWVYQIRQPDPELGSGIPFLFVGAIAVFIIVAFALRFAPPLTATWIGTINLIVLYVTLLYVFIAGAIYYLRTRTGLIALSVLAIYVFLINILSLFIGPRSSEKPRAWAARASGPAAAAQSEDQFKAWFRHRSKSANPSHPVPVFLIASSGGGMRAAIRTVTFLDHMQTRCPDFLRHTFAISGVSGGSLGALLYAAQQQLQPSNQVGCRLLEPPADATGRMFESAPLLDRFFATDVIPAIVGPGLFTETLQRLLPPGLLTQFDRSVSFNEVLAASWHDSVMTYKAANKVPPGAASGCEVENYLKSCDSNSYWDPSKNVPLLVFNATSATDGGLVPLSNVDLSYFDRLPLSRGIQAQAGVPNPFSFELLKAASASARFPIALPAATLQGADGRRHTLVDGAYFDNSGLLVARAIRKRIETIIAESQAVGSGEPINATVHIIYLRERETNKFTCENMPRGDGGSSGEAGARAAATPTDDALNSDLAHVNAFLRARDKRDLMNEFLINEIDKASLISIEWDLHEMPPVMAMPAADGAAPSKTGSNCEDLREVSPLAFYYAPTTRWKFKIFLENEILDPKNLDSLREVQSLLYPGGGR